MSCWLMLPWVVAAAIPSGNEIRVSARLQGDKLEVGRDYEISLSVQLAEGVDASGSGLPAPILQIEVPSSAKLQGKVLTTYQELSHNEFLQAPYERLLKRSVVPIGFTLLKPPAPDDAFHLNIVAYVRTHEKGPSRFVRRRFVLPLQAGAVAREIAPTSSSWGVDTGLQIGDSAVSFTLPRADGSTVSLDTYLGKKNILVTTYRAFW